MLYKLKISETDVSKGVFSQKGVFNQNGYMVTDSCGSHTLSKYQYSAYHIPGILGMMGFIKNDMILVRFYPEDEVVDLTYAKCVEAGKIYKGANFVLNQKYCYMECNNVLELIQLDSSCGNTMYNRIEKRIYESYDFYERSCKMSEDSLEVEHKRFFDDVSNIFYKGSISRPIDIEKKIILLQSGMSSFGYKTIGSKKLVK